MKLKEKQILDQASDTECFAVWLNDWLQDKISTEVSTFLEMQFISAPSDLET